MRPFDWWVTQYHQIMLSLSKLVLVNMVKKHVFSSLNISEIFKFFFGIMFLNTVLDTYTKKINPPSACFGRCVAKFAGLYPKILYYRIRCQVKYITF